ncbi:MAG: iron-containing alcohol dehydrogenase [Chloroflexi bacterium]|nr:MAG: iron-containing alcohol dehydrogenase [Chloroflexota bacterium]
MATSYYIPTVNLIGEGALEDAAEHINRLGHKKAMIVTGKTLHGKLKLTSHVTKMLDGIGIEYVIFDGVQPNPTIDNVEKGLAAYKASGCDFMVSFGGGSNHDCAKSIGMVAVGGGSIRDYEGLNKCEKGITPLVAINTTSGTGSECTQFSIITDPERRTKMVILDHRATPALSINDPALHEHMPPELTAATGMDALTHAVEAVVALMANPISDCTAFQAINLVFKHLPAAVENGHDKDAREHMIYAQFLAACAFNSAGLGFVHGMAHQLGGFYDLPHGVCNAILLPRVQAYNAEDEATAKRLAGIAQYMGKNVVGLSTSEASDKAIEAIYELSAKVGIPTGLKELGVKEKDLPTLVENTLKDPCCLANPRPATAEGVMSIFQNAM